MEPTFALPDQIRYDRDVPWNVGTVTEIVVVTHYAESSAITVPAGNLLCYKYSKIWK